MHSDLSIDSLKENLLAASSEWEFLLVLYKTKLTIQYKTDILIEKLAQLHNSEQIDLINNFKVLENKSDTEISFFYTREIFEEALPKLNADTREVMDCVLHLVEAAGQDMAAKTVFGPFTEYCSADGSRPVEGLRLIEQSPDKYVSFLVPVLKAGSQIDFESYLDKAICLSVDDNIEFRRRALLSLGQLQYPENSITADRALETLELSVDKETDDILLSHVIEAAFSLFKRNVVLDSSRVTELIDAVLLKGDSYTLYAASHIFGFSYKYLPTSLVDILLSHLQQVASTHIHTLDNIDHGVVSLLRNGECDKGIDFLEKCLLKKEGSITLSIFNSTSCELLKNQGDILNRVMTKWFLLGNPKLCEGIASVVKLSRGQELTLSVELEESGDDKSDEMIFIARKAIGYLFFQPVFATSVIVSLLKQTSDSTVLQVLSALLFDPLLLNYSGKVSGYLEQQLQIIEEQHVKEAIKNAIKAFENYIDDLKSTGDLPELHPSQRNREVYRRRFGQQMSEAVKNAQKESVFLSLVSKSVLLYGRKSINYVYSSDGEARRMEVPLKSYGTEMEFPRLETIDPFGLDYMLRIFRAEQIRNHEADH
ncbi:MAG: hypothetical protein AAF959_00655 [Cyanobacteria bacterium P01_D01_bin.56]